MTPEPQAPPPQAPKDDSPTLVPLLLVINLLVFAWGSAHGVNPFSPTTGMLLNFGANFGASFVFDHEWWRPLTSMFVHVGLMHLLVNMYSLWAVGPFAERMLGDRVFLTLYLLSGLAGSFASMLWNPLTVSAGASGALFGLFGVVLAYAFRGRGLLPEHAVQRLRGSIVTTLVLNVAMASMNPLINHAAHFGGLVAGTLGGVMATASAVEQPDRRPKLLSQAIVLALVVGLAVLVVQKVSHDADLLARFPKAAN
jgi:rhomboid protease GluP